MRTYRSHFSSGPRLRVKGIVSDDTSWPKGRPNDVQVGVHDAKQRDYVLLERLYEAELAAFNRYVAERTGAQVEATDLENRRIAPSRVTRAYDTWVAAHAALKAGGGTAQAIRAMLQEKHGGNGDPT